MDDDRIGHAELDVAGATLYLADEYPELGLTGPEDGRVSVTLHLSVPDVDARGRPRRCTPARRSSGRPTDAPYGRTGVIVDPYGHRWMLQTPTPAPASGPRPGDAVYLTLRVPDGARARDFYEAVLGWSAVPGRVPDGWQVEGTTPDDRHRRRRDRPGRRADVRRRRHRGRGRRGPHRGRRGRRDRAAAVRAVPRSAATTRACRSTWVSWAEAPPARRPPPGLGSPPARRSSRRVASASRSSSTSSRSRRTCRRR